MLITCTLKLMSLTNINFVCLLVSTIEPRRYFKLKVTMAYVKDQKFTTEISKIKPMSRHDVHLHSLINTDTKYQFPNLYSFQNIAQTRF